MFARFQAGEAPGEGECALDDPPSVVAAIVPASTSEIVDASEDPMQHFLGECQRPRTRQTMQEALDRVGVLLGVPTDRIPWARLRRPQVLEIKSRLVARYSPRTTNVTLVAVRGVLKAAWLMDLIPGGDYARAIAVKSLKIKRLPKGRWLPDDDVAKMMAYARTFGPEAREWPESAYGAFLEAVFALLLGAGLRASEVANLPLIAYGRGELRFIRKGDKEDTVGLGGEVIESLDAWLAVRAELDAQGPAMFPRVLQSGAIGRRPLTRRTVERICKRAARLAGVTSFSPHDLRRTFITDMLTGGTDLATVQRLAGHESPATTVIYDRRPLEADAAARRKVNILGRGSSKRS